MSGNALLLVFLGTSFTVFSLLAFLFALRLGLRHKKWWPLVVITVLWLIAMGAYALLESGTGPDSSRQRIGQTLHAD